MLRLCMYLLEWSTTSILQGSNPEKMQRHPCTWAAAQLRSAHRRGVAPAPVSYTHLTLPTICSV
eukprot:3802625-Alexandrium_andersonii.AAC.1